MLDALFAMGRGHQDVGSPIPRVPFWEWHFGTHPCHERDSAQHTTQQAPSRSVMLCRETSPTCLPRGCGRTGMWVVGGRRRVLRGGQGVWPPPCARTPSSAPAPCARCCSCCSCCWPQPTAWVSVHHGGLVAPNNGVGGGCSADWRCLLCMQRGSVLEDGCCG